MGTKKSNRVPIPDAMPSLLSHNADNVGLGSVLMRLEDNRRAVVVDSVMCAGDSDAHLIVAYVSDRAMRRLDENGKREPIYPHDPKDYSFERIHCRASGWLVLELGPKDYDVLVD